MPTGTACITAAVTPGTGVCCNDVGSGTCCQEPPPVNDPTDEVAGSADWGECERAAGGVIELVSSIVMRGEQALMTQVVWLEVRATFVHLSHFPTLGAVRLQPMKTTPLCPFPSSPSAK